MIRRRVGKTGEELAELSVVLNRIQIQGIDGVDPGTGKTNRWRLHEEIADVVAQLNVNIRVFDMDRTFLKNRIKEKEGLMEEWENLYKSED